MHSLKTVSHGGNCHWLTNILADSNVLYCKKHLYSVLIYTYLRLQCFDAVGWAAGRASLACKKLSGGVLVWLSLEHSADLHMAQLMPLTVSCFSEIHIGFAFLVQAHPGSPGQRAVKRLCVCVIYMCMSLTIIQFQFQWLNWLTSWITNLTRCHFHPTLSRQNQFALVYMVVHRYIVRK